MKIFQENYFFRVFRLNFFHLKIFKLKYKIVSQQFKKTQVNVSQRDIFHKTFYENTEDSFFRKILFTNITNYSGKIKCCLISFICYHNLLKLYVKKCL